MEAIIITIGDEILLGHILDTNSQFIANKLTDIGMEVIDILSIADKREEILYWTDYAMQHSDLVIVTGGLGPTNDDVTKKVLTEYFGTTLVLHENILKELEERMNRRGFRMTENNKSQAYLPENCQLIPNSKGTALGMIFERRGKYLISMPGVPFEMESMMEHYVAPKLKELYPGLLFEYRMLKVYNIPESELADRLSDWENRLPRDVSLAYLPTSSLVKLRLTAREAGVRRLDELFDNLRQILSDLHCSVGEESGVEYELGRLLMAKGKTIATAESCTGGNIAHKITLVPGSSAYYRGSVVSYANEVKVEILGVKPKDLERFGAVSKEVVLQMAEGVKRLLKSDYAVATSGIAGPDGGSVEKPVGTIWIAVATPDRTFAKKYLFSFTRERNIGKATVQAIQMLLDELK